MIDQQNIGPGDLEVRVTLIDPQTSRSLKYWKFYRATEITIGRAEGSHVELLDPYVSRHHASLVQREDGWYLVSLGRNGVLVDGQTVTEAPTGQALSFRLGVRGPELRFSIQAIQSGSPKDGDSLMIETTQFDARLVAELERELSSEVPHEINFELDQVRLDREVNEVMESDYFQRLQNLSRQLKGKM